MAALTRTMLVIGIGAGDPDHLTLQAIKAMRRTEVVFLVEKRRATRPLEDLRRRMLAEHAPQTPRVVTIEDPDRERDPADYRATVAAWRAERARRWGEAIDTHLPAGSTGAFLVWGDPAFYDSTLDVLRDLALPELAIEVIPGISSPQALAAAHAISLNRIGGAIEITPGRRYAGGMPPDVDDAVVMLDTQTVFTGAPDDVDIYWGAYLGTPDQLLVAGPVREVENEIVRVREEARTRRGWMFDTYLLRRRQPG